MWEDDMRVNDRPSEQDAGSRARWVEETQPGGWSGRLMAASFYNNRIRTVSAIAGEKSEQLWQSAFVEVDVYTPWRWFKTLKMLEINKLEAADPQ